MTRLGVGVIGSGAIGSVVADALHKGRVTGARLSGVVRGSANSDVFEAVLEASDVVIEAASQAAVAEYGPRVKEAGRDFVVLSVGALADDELMRLLGAPDGGRLLISSGACGGIDILRSAQLLAPLERVRLETTKANAVLLRDWMDEADRQALVGEKELTVFEGSARDATRLFPETANIAATLALATLGFDRMEVAMRADPRAQSARHEITASGEAGVYRFLIENALSAQNRRTSGVTAYSVLRGLADRSAMVVPGC